ncbi:hypothetical protein [Streptomyces cellostaticus]|uniref:hypothetical protein n=1 Tax=Streptomyces cellostaticus TaxID=67285 RepID=UPI00082A3674|nr:hypothetical protein [Streptomyces cellostaticus]
MAAVKTESSEAGLSDLRSQRLGRRATVAPHGRRVRGVDIRGDAELLVDPHELGPHLSDELIRVPPRRVHSWGLEEN